MTDVDRPHRIHCLDCGSTRLLNSATSDLFEQAERVTYSDWLSIRQEIERIACRAAEFEFDARLLKELVDLREFRDKHPLPFPKKPSLGEGGSSSEFIRMAEAALVFGEYARREQGRLSEKMSLLGSGEFSTAARQYDLDIRELNERIFEKGICIEREVEDPNNV